MKKYLLISICALFIVALKPVTLKAQQATEAGVKISGEVTAPFTVKASDMQQLNRVSVSRKDRDNKDHQYTGVSLLTLLQKAGATTGKELRGENLTKYALVEASDGYQVIFTLAELDKEFTDREIILADQMDGKPLPLADGPFRIVIQDEKKPARCMKQVTSIRIAFAK